MIARMVVIGTGGAGVLVLGIVILIGAGAAGSSTAGCGSGPSAAGQPPMVQYYILAAQAAGLGPDGYAYLAAINNVESDFGSSGLPGVVSGTNAAGAAGPMQIGVGGASSDTWDRLAGLVPVDLPGGADPVSVYNPADAIYAAGQYLQGAGAPADWQAALYAYNHAEWYVQEVAQLAPTYLSAGGLNALVTAIASSWGGRQPPQATLVSTTSPAASAPQATSTSAGYDGRTGTTTTTKEGSVNCGAVDAQGYADPWAHATGLSAMRIDMGVDYEANGPIDAVGDGTITYAQAQGTGWGPYSCSGGGAGAVVEQLSDGSAKGRWIYIAEGVVPTVTAGTTVTAGQQIGRFVGCVEIGWADGPGPNPRAADLHQDAVSLGLSSDPGADPTGCGEQMNQLLVATGAASGLQGSRIDGSGC